MDFIFHPAANLAAYAERTCTKELLLPKNIYTPRFAVLRQNGVNFVAFLLMVIFFAYGHLCGTRARSHGARAPIVISCPYYRVMIGARVLQTSDQLQS
jgi:hypothetical protein